MKIKEKVLTIFSRCNRWFDDAYAETMRFYDIFGAFQDETPENECNERIEKRRNKKKEKQNN